MRQTFVIKQIKPSAILLRPVLGNEVIDESQLSVFYFVVVAQQEIFEDK